MNNNSRLVYSTDGGRVCPKCNKPQARCVCGKKSASPVKKLTSKDGVIRIQREKQGRKGKTVSAIYGLPLPPDELAALARSLKQRCGTGGTVKDGIIIIQGDHRNVLLQELQGQGYNAKLAGG